MLAKGLREQAWGWMWRSTVMMPSLRGVNDHDLINLDLMLPRKEVRR